MNYFIAKIGKDVYPISPRESDTFGTFVSLNDDILLSDEDFNISAEVFQSMIESDDTEDYIYLPVYIDIYKRPCLTMLSTVALEGSNEHIGYIYVHKEDIKCKFSLIRDIESVREDVYDILEAELYYYNQFINGDVFFYYIKRVSKSYIEENYPNFNFDVYDKMNLQERYNFTISELIGYNPNEYLEPIDGFIESGSEYYEPESLRGIVEASLFGLLEYQYKGEDITLSALYKTVNNINIKE